MAWIAIEFIRYGIESGGDIIHLDIHDIIMHQRQIFTVDNGPGAVFNGLFHKPVAVACHAFDTEKDGIRTPFPAVSHQTSDFYIRYIFKKLT